MFRGKTKGHDLDILVTHPVSGEEKELLKKILEALSMFFVVNCLEFEILIF